MRLTETAHRLVSAHLSEGGVAVDATVGRGRDSLFLARAVGGSGRVYGFDIQSIALEHTRKLLVRSGVSGRVRLVRASHHRMRCHLPAGLRCRIQAIMFNLGYLPGSGWAVVTRPATTLPALDQALGLLAPGGILSAIAYPGHPSGEEETDRVSRWFEEQAALSDEVRSVRPDGTGSTAPRLLMLRRRG